MIIKNNLIKFYAGHSNNLKLRGYRVVFAIVGILLLGFLEVNVFAQTRDIDFTLDINSKTKATPLLIQKPGLDFSGRGFHNYPTQPQNLASEQVLTEINKHLDLQGGVFRIQFDLWEFVQLAKNKQMQSMFLENYSTIINNINASGGITIVNLYGMPPGVGTVLDKKSSPWDITAFKSLVKGIIKYLSCDKGYNIWYEIWTAPDLDDFFIGQKQEYFQIYQAIAETIKELEKETNRNIPVGGPGVTWWFQAIEGNSILYPEKSLIYELIRFCSQRRLPLDFISWHAYTSDPLAESEVTSYNKTVPELIREWLSYFGLGVTTPLVISEWNYDTGLNFELKRGWESYVAASFIPSRIKNMIKAGIDYQVFYCLEDFKNNKEGVNRNVGLFWFEPEYLSYTGGPKSMFNVIRMMNMLGSEMYLSSRLDNEFVGIFATKTKTGIALLLFNYIDPHIVRNSISRRLAALSAKDIRGFIKLMKSGTFEKIMNKEVPLNSLKLNKRIKTKIEEAILLSKKFEMLAQEPQNINLQIDNLQGDYSYKKYVVDKSCRLDCAFTARDEKEIKNVDNYREVLRLEPYSVVLIVIDKVSECSSCAN